MTRYYIRKQNLRVSDEFHERIAPSDVEELNRAVVYAAVAPIVTTAIVWGYSKLREQGGASSHFAHAIRRARNRFTPERRAGGKSGSKWPSSKQQKDSSKQTLAEMDLGLTDSQKSSEAIADVYKQMKQERKDAMEEKLRSSKEKAQEGGNLAGSRRMVRNMDPFERQRKQMN